MKLNDLIMKLQNLEAEVGNVDVYHSDCEWGIDEASCELYKVIDMPNGESSYKYNLKPEDAEKIREEVTAGFNEVTAMAECMSWWNDDDRMIFKNPKEVVDNARLHFERQKQVLALYDAAPFAIVF